MATRYANYYSHFHAKTVDCLQGQFLINFELNLYNVSIEVNDM